MDLVSSTLDKYLKHRFSSNGNGKIQTITDNGTPQTESDDISLMVHNVSIKNLVPCCISLSDDLRFIAAGFENSHIYLWTLDNAQPSSSSSASLTSPSKPQHQSQQQQRPNNSNNHEDVTKKIITTATTNNNIAKIETTATPITSCSLKIESISKLLAHSGPVYCVAFVNYNDLMLSCSEDTTIRLWCLKTKCNLIVYRGHNYPIWSLTVAPQGEYFASASMDATARLWRLDKMCPLRIFCGHEDDVECVKFHPNEKYVATGSTDSTVRLWSTSDGKMVRLMVGHKNPIISLSFLPNGKFLASASSEGAIKVWNLATNCVTNDLSVPASRTISFSPEQKFISSCGMDNVLRLWQLCESGLIEKKKLDFSSEPRKLIQSYFHRDNKLFVIDYRTIEASAKIAGTGPTTNSKNSSCSSNSNSNSLN